MPDVEREQRPFGSRHSGPILLVASVLWAAAGLISRAAPISGSDLAFWRCLLGAAIYTIVVTVQGRRLTWASLRDSWLGGIGFGLSVVCIFIAYKSTTLVSATVIGSMQPLVLGLVTQRTSHRLGKLLWASSVVAAAGTVVVVLGSSAHTGTWSLHGDLFAVAGIAANMLYVVGTKRARERRGPLEYQASMLWIASVVLLPVALATSGRAFVPEPVAWWSIAGMVAVGGTGHLLFSLAQHHVSVAASSAIMLTEVLAIALGGAVLFHQPITAVQTAGMVIVAVSVGVWLRRDPGEPAAAPDPLELISPAATLST